MCSVYDFSYSSISWIVILRRRSPPTTSSKAKTASSFDQSFNMQDDNTVKEEANYIEDVIPANPPVNSLNFGRSGMSGGAKVEPVLLTTMAHPISFELQRLFLEFTEGATSDSEELRHRTLDNLSIAEGLEPLLPRFGYFFMYSVNANLAQDSFELLKYLVDMVCVLLTNENVNLEPEIHLILPGLMSILISSCDNIAVRSRKKKCATLLHFIMLKIPETADDIIECLIKKLNNHAARGPSIFGIASVFKIMDSRVAEYGLFPYLESIVEIIAPSKRMNLQRGFATGPGAFVNSSTLAYDIIARIIRSYKKKNRTSTVFNGVFKTFSDVVEKNSLNL